MIPSIDTFVAHVAAHAAISLDAAELVTRTTLAGIGARLSPPVRTFIAEELPPDLRAAVLIGADLAIPLEEAVRTPGMTVGVARELIASVGRVLGETLSDDALALIAATGADLAQIVQRAAPEEMVRAAPSRHPTLAAGRPGSAHPLSEARPDRRHASSVAADNPHAEQKLSSTTGTTQERLHETIAEGRPGSEWPLSRGH